MIRENRQTGRRVVQFVYVGIPLEEVTIPYTGFLRKSSQVSTFVEWDGTTDWQRNVVQLLSRV